MFNSIFSSEMANQRYQLRIVLFSYERTMITEFLTNHLRRIQRINPTFMPPDFQVSHTHDLLHFDMQGEDSELPAFEFFAATVSLVQQTSPPRLFFSVAIDENIFPSFSYIRLPGQPEAVAASAIRLNSLEGSLSIPPLRDPPQQDVSIISSFQLPLILENLMYSTFPYQWFHPVEIKTGKLTFPLNPTAKGYIPVQQNVIPPPPRLLNENDLSFPWNEELQTYIPKDNITAHGLNLDPRVAPRNANIIPEDDIRNASTSSHRAARARERADLLDGVRDRFNPPPPTTQASSLPQQQPGPPTAASRPLLGSLRPQPQTQVPLAQALLPQAQAPRAPDLPQMLQDQFASLNIDPNTATVQHLAPILQDWAKQLQAGLTPKNDFLWDYFLPSITLQNQIPLPSMHQAVDGPIGDSSSGYSSTVQQTQPDGSVRPRIQSPPIPRGSLATAVSPSASGAATAITTVPSTSTTVSTTAPSVVTTAASQQPLLPAQVTPHPPPPPPSIFPLVHQQQTIPQVLSHDPAAIVNTNDYTFSDDHSPNGARQRTQSAPPVDPNTLPQTDPQFISVPLTPQSVVTRGQSGIVKPVSRPDFVTDSIAAGTSAMKSAKSILTKSKKKAPSTSQDASTDK